MIHSLINSCGKKPLLRTTLSSPSLVVWNVYIWIKCKNTNFINIEFLYMSKSKWLHWIFQNHVRLESKRPKLIGVNSNEVSNCKIDLLVDGISTNCPLTIHNSHFTSIIANGWLIYSFPLLSTWQQNLCEIGNENQIKRTSAHTNFVSKMKKKKKERKKKRTIVGLPFVCFQF